MKSRQARMTLKLLLCLAGSLLALAISFHAPLLAFDYNEWSPDFDEGMPISSFPRYGFRSSEAERLYNLLTQVLEPAFLGKHDLGPETLESFMRNLRRQSSSSDNYQTKTAELRKILRRQGIHSVMDLIALARINQLSSAHLAVAIMFFKWLSPESETLWQRLHSEKISLSERDRLLHYIGSFEVVATSELADPRMDCERETQLIQFAHLFRKWREATEAKELNAALWHFLLALRDLAQSQPQLSQELFRLFARFDLRPKQETWSLEDGGANALFRFARLKSEGPWLVHLSDDAYTTFLFSGKLEQGVGGTGANKLATIEAWAEAPFVRISAAVLAGHAYHPKSLARLRRRENGMPDLRQLAVACSRGSRSTRERASVPFPLEHWR